MPAPKAPNTSAATEASVAARTRAKHEKWAKQMRAAGWTAYAPGELANFDTAVLPVSMPPQRFVLVTFVVTEDGEKLQPMSEAIARVPLDDTGQPVSFDDLTERVARYIRRRWSPAS